MEPSDHVSPSTKALETALSAVSGALVSLRKSGILTTDLMDDKARYVPSSMLSDIEEAATTTRFAKAAIQDHRAFVDRAMFEMDLLGEGLRTDRISELRDALDLGDREAPAFVAQARALHMARQLDIGWNLLLEIEQAGLMTISGEVRDLRDAAIEIHVVPTRFKDRDGCLADLAERMRGMDLVREAELLASLRGYRPSINGGGLFRH